VGMKRTGSVTIQNLDPTWPLTVHRLSILDPGDFLPSGASSFPTATKLPGGATAKNFIAPAGRQEDRLAPSAAAPGALDAAAPSSVLIYGLDLLSGHLHSFLSDKPGDMTDLGPVAAPYSPYYACDFAGGDFSKLYLLDADASKLLAMNTATGEIRTIGMASTSGGQIWVGLTGSPNGLLYGVSAEAYVSGTAPAKLYRIDPQTGASTFVGEIKSSDVYNPVSPFIQCIAMNARGELYGMDSGKDNLVSIDPQTGAAVVVGPLGVNAEFSQGMDFDEVNNILYWAAWSMDTGRQELRVINLSTGASTLVAPFEGFVQYEMAVANGGPAFRLVNPPSQPFVVPPGGSVNVSVEFAPRAYVNNQQARLVVQSNDFDEPAVALQLTGAGRVDYLTVTPASGVSASGHPGGPFTPATAVYTLQNTRTSAIDWSASLTTGIVQLSSMGGSIPASSSIDVTVSFTAAAASLPPGVYTDRITFTDLATGQVAAARDVVLTIFTSPHIAVTPASFSVTLPYGGSDTRTLNVANLADGDAPLSFVVASSNTAWLTVAPESGANLAPGSNVDCTVTLAPGALQPGTYNSQLNVHSNDFVTPLVVVPVSMTVVADSLNVTPTTTFASSGIQGGPFTPASRNYTLTNTSAAPLDYSAATPAWITANPANGTLAAGANVTVTATINAAANTLAPGLHAEDLLFTNVTTGKTHPRRVELTVNLPAPAVFWSEPLDTDPGWAREGQWGFGTPTGRFGDPTSGYTGPNVFGYNLKGRYGDFMPKYCLTTTAIDCSGRSNVTLKFWRKMWNGPSGSESGDHATIEASNDGVNWTVIWNHYGNTFKDAAWTEMTCDVSAVADGQPTFYLRWSQGPTDAGTNDFGGWNIDDLTLTGATSQWLTVSPLEGVTAIGYPGGPITPASATYRLRNIAARDIDWSAAASQPWLDITPNGGTLAAGATLDVSVAFNAAAMALPVGAYSCDVVFTDLSSSTDHTRPVNLTILDSAGEITVTDSVPPVSDLFVPFGGVQVGTSATQTVTLHNSDANYPLVFTGFLMRPVKNVAPFSAPTIEPSADSANALDSTAGEPLQLTPPWDLLPAAGTPLFRVPALTAAPRAVPAWGVDLLAGRLVSFMTDKPGDMVRTKAADANTCAVEFLNGDFTTLYAITRAEQLVRIDVATGLQTIVGPCEPEMFFVWTGLAQDPTDGALYATAVSAPLTLLYRINPLNGAVTRIGRIHFGDGYGSMINVMDIAVNSRGEMYGISQGLSCLLRIDATSGFSQVVGSLDMPETQLNYLSGLDFDEDTDTLYFSPYTSDGGAALYTLDTTTSGSTKIGDFPYGSCVTMAIAAGGRGGAFEVLNPPAFPHSIAPGGSYALQIRYAPQTVRDDESKLTLRSNDADEPNVEVRLTGSGLPSNLDLSPDDYLISQGHPGGPFTPETLDYTISNFGPAPIQWEIRKTEDWVSVSPAAGTLAPGTSGTVTVGFTAAASALPVGEYSDLISFVNITAGGRAEHTREVRLDVFTAPEVGVSPTSMTVVTVMGGSTKRPLTISNAPGADDHLDIQLTAGETGRSLNALAAGETGHSVSRIAAAAQAAARLTPPPGRDFTVPQPGATFRPGRMLVRFANGATSLERTAALQAAGGATVRHEYRIVPGLCLVDLPAGMTVESALQSVNGQPGVLYAEPDYEAQALATIPNDPSFAQLWGMNNTGQGGGTPDADIDAPEAWDTATGSERVVVAVIDTGVDYTHADLAANIWTNPGEIPGNGLDDDGNGFVDDVHGYDFINNDGDPMDDMNPIYHGTHCAGTIGAVGNNGVGVAGVCWNVRIMALKFLGASGSGDTSDAVRAVEYAVLMGARLTSNSWGGGGATQSLRDAIAAAGAAGQLFIAAAGNSNRDNDLTPLYPTGYDCDNIISVMATDSNDVRASFSCYGATTVDIAAPGVGIYSCKAGNAYQSLSGTSMATPHVAGAAALLLSVDPALTWAEIKAILLDTADRKASLTKLCVSEGRLNIAAAVERATAPWLFVDPKSAAAIAPGAAKDATVAFRATDLAAGTYYGQITVRSNDPFKPMVRVPVTMIVQPQGTLLPGDVNADGSVNTTDTLLIRDHLLKRSLLTGDFLTRADANADGAVDAADLIWTAANPFTPSL